MNHCPNRLHRIKQKTDGLKREVLTMYLAVQHSSTPWYAKVLAIVVVVYALSPIDLIPDPVPILGYLDDMILIPVGVMAVRWMIPAVVLDECREQVRTGIKVSPAWKWAGGIAVAALWIICLVCLGIGLWRYVAN